jgi:hypothetical protein
MSKEFNRAMRAVDSQRTHRTDENLARIRGYWERWNKEERSSFNEWLARLADLDSTMPKLVRRLFPDLGVLLHLEFVEQTSENDCCCYSPPILAIRKAMEHWERGEPYTPTKLDELLG